MFNNAEDVSNVAGGCEQQTLEMQHEQRLLGPDYGDSSKAELKRQDFILLAKEVFGGFWSEGGVA